MQQTIGLDTRQDVDDLVDEDGDDIVGDADMIRILRELAQQAEAKPASMDRTLKKNLDDLVNLLKLNEIDRAILLFTVVIQTNRGLYASADLIGELDARQVAYVLAALLDQPVKGITASLSPRGLLAQSGLLKVDRIIPRHITDLSNKLELLRGLDERMFEPQRDVLDMLNGYFRKSVAARLSQRDFPHMDAQYRMLERYLKRALERGQRGVNVLIHGRPGTGKTEFARALAKSVGAALMEVNMMDDDGDSMNGEERFAAYRLSQHSLARRGNTMILFDEIEDVFPQMPFALFQSESGHRANKAWINLQLEDNPVPAIWISNTIGQIDNAYLRRFDMVLKLDQPPRKVRLSILAKHFGGLPVSRKYLEQLADHAELPPAVAARAADVVRVLGDRKGETAEAHVDCLLRGTLEAMGHAVPAKTTAQAATRYDLDAVNPDRDLHGLVAGLERHPAARICLYGPPGTGKTEFGRHLARQLDRPLLVKRASDLLSPYVGMTEAAIAAMFREALEEDAVLLLDEADSFLRDRRGARQSWEVTQVNELLTQMEAFSGIFVCSTNLVDDLDAASLRRFDLKVKLDYLKPAQALVLFRMVLEDHGTGLDESGEGMEYWSLRIGGLRNLTPGDFATVVRQSRFGAQPLTPQRLYEGLARELRFKDRGNRQGIGFTAAI